MPGRFGFIRVFAIGALAVIAANAMAQEPLPSFVPPPRSIADITAILDQEKPDPGKIAQQTAAADATPKPGLDDAGMIDFLVRRGAAETDIGRDAAALADLRAAVEMAGQRHDTAELVNAMNELARAEIQSGSVATGMKLRQDAAARALANNLRFGIIFGAYREMVTVTAREGRFDDAKVWLQKIDALFDNTMRNPRGQQIAFQNWYRFFVDDAHAEMLDASGQFPEAETYYRRAVAEARKTESDASGVAGISAPPPNSYLTSADITEDDLALALMRHGRLLEAEVEARQALLSQLKIRGRYAVQTVSQISTLATIVMQEGRYPEAEKLARAALETYDTLNLGESSTVLNEGRAALASVLMAQSKSDEALSLYGKIATALADDERSRNKYLDTNIDYAIAALDGNRLDLATKVAQAAVDAQSRIAGAGSYQTAEAEGILAAVLARAGKTSDARDLFGKAVPVLLGASRHDDDPEGDDAAGLQATRLGVVIEAYLDVLSIVKTPDAAAEAFRIADAARGQSVQRAVAAAAARVSVSDVSLAEIVRRDQDAEHQLTALDALLANSLALPSSERDSASLGSVRADIDALKAARVKLREEIRQRFPGYAELIDPKPATAEAVQHALREDEALFAVFIGSRHAYVWAVPKSGAIAFAVSPMRPADIVAAVARLRKSLEPAAVTVTEIPAFDVEAAYQLYASLLEPVKAGWQTAKSLLVVPHGPLGQLPFGLLATQNQKPAADVAGKPLFQGYRSVPWLIRRVAITQLPSVTSLTTLRSMSGRGEAAKPFIGFGDPWFSKKEQARAIEGSAAGTPADDKSPIAMREAPIHLRSMPKTEAIDTAELAELPRLPETADEVREVAAALNADPAKDVFLGAQANEQTVRTAKLDDRRVVMFATHGLVPGDLDGLTEPALALSAPDVAQVPGNGLLTVSKILGLRLNAEWVVLSACNTAAGNGAGAEAVSGLGLAFFYAGSRALLVSNWPVETMSARLLTTEVFKREAATPGLARAEALRQAMLALIDGPGALDPATNKPAYSYAHPLFWAPFSLVGDGGAG